MLKVEVKKPEISYFTDGSVGGNYGVAGFISMNDHNEIYKIHLVSCCPNIGIAEALGIHDTLLHIKESNDKKSEHNIYTDSKSCEKFINSIVKDFDKYLEIVKTKDDLNSFVIMMMNISHLYLTLIQSGFTINIFHVRAHVNYREQKEHAKLNNYNFNFEKINHINLGNHFIDNLVYTSTMFKVSPYPIITKLPNYVPLFTDNEHLLIA